MGSIAIIGAGITGLACAHFLHRRHSVQVFEKAPRIGGNARTVDLETAAGRIPVDTTFNVVNRVTYPNFCRLLAQLGVGMRPVSVSHSVRDDVSGVEWCGTSLNQLFAQRRNLLSPSFWSMLVSIERFNREAADALRRPETREMSFAQYLQRHRYSDAFIHLYLKPLTAGMWSVPAELAMEFPAATLLRYFHNHGLLGTHTQHSWLAIDGCTENYLSRICEPIRDRVHTGVSLLRIEREAGRGVVVHMRGRPSERFDRVIMATPADHALQLISDPSPDERRLLGEFRYQAHLSIIHTDQSVMPRSRRAWATRNHHLARTPDGRIQPCVHHWLNPIHGLEDEAPLFVSLNAASLVAPERIIKTVASQHALLNLWANRAQTELPSLNTRALGSSETYFAGSYFRHGFHEDGLLSALQLCEFLIGGDPWCA